MAKKTKIKIDEAKFNEALKLRDKSEYNKAIRLLKDLLKENPDAPEIYGVLGGIYFNIDKYNEAFHYMKKTTILSPKSELASLGVFHSLWELGKKKEALEEMDRILELKPDSENFIPLLRGLEKDAGNGQLNKIIFDIKKVADKHLA